MSATRSPTGNPRLDHPDVWELLPWYVNHTLDAHERARVEAHLSDCVTCRAELATLRRVERDVRDDVALHDTMERSLATARQRLDREEGARGAKPGAGRASASGVLAVLRHSHPGIKAALLAQAAALVLVVGAGLTNNGGTGPTGAGGYRTLSDGTAPLPAAADGVATVRVKAADGIGEAAFRATLLDLGLRIVDGPTPSGLYTLALSEPERGDAGLLEVAARLQALPAIGFVGPVSTPPSGTP